VLSSFVVPVRFPADAQLWFSSSDASTALPVGNLIKQIKEQLQKLSPTVLAHWPREGLQWAACCGDLRLVAESVIIYLYVIDDATPEDVMPFIHALDTILRTVTDEKTNISTCIKQSNVFPYFRAALRALPRIAEVAAFYGG
jgi:hypothetical protein